MKLIARIPPASSPSPRSSLYEATKHYYHEVEASDRLSLPILQSGILLDLYELGHGIYPAAFLSIGACARFAHTLGITDNRAVGARKVLTLVEVEERRRVRWAIVILDR
jgi:hypothetical protein